MATKISASDKTTAEGSKFSQTLWIVVLYPDGVYSKVPFIETVQFGPASSLLRPSLLVYLVSLHSPPSVDNN